MRGRHGRSTLHGYGLAPCTEGWRPGVGGEPPSPLRLDRSTLRGYGVDGAICNPQAKTNPPTGGECARISPLLQGTKKNC